MSAAHLVSTYVDTQKTSQLIFDKLMVTLALSISEHALASGGDILTDKVLELIRITTNDNLYYKVIGPGGAFIMGFEDIPLPPGGINILESNLHFYDALYWGEDVRIIAVSSLVDNPDFSGWMTTYVAQTLNDREEYVRSIMMNASLRVLIMILITSTLLSIGVVQGLRPLKKLAAAVNRRHTNNLDPIEHNDLPLEIQGVVAELNDLLQRLSLHTALTKRFVENAAHQLRTPVAALLPRSELALRHAESERERTAIGKIKQSAEQIARLTHQLLSLTHAETISINNSEFSCIDLAKVTEPRIKMFMEHNPLISLKTELKKASIHGIELFIGEVLDNLLDNAKKYGGDLQTITVRTGIEGKDSYLEVIDQGPGIAITDREKVTERFFRLENKIKGTGLGLAIIKEIIEAHQGRLEILDGPDVGTCFRACFKKISS